MLDTRLKINAIEVRRGEESNWMIVVRGEVFFSLWADSPLAHDELCC